MAGIGAVLWDEYYPVYNSFSSHFHTKVDFVLPATRDVCSPCPLQASWGSCCMSTEHGRGETAPSQGLCLIYSYNF